VNGECTLRRYQEYLFIDPGIYWSVKHQSRDDISKSYSLLVCTYARSNKLRLELLYWY